MSNSISVGIRIPSDLYEQIEIYGKENKPRGKDGYDKTATLLELIKKGLNPENSECDNTLPTEFREEDRKELREELFNDMKEFLGYQLKAFKQEVLNAVKQDVKQDNRVSSLPTNNIEEDETIKRMNLEIEEIRLTVGNMKVSLMGEIHEELRKINSTMTNVIKQKNESNNEVLDTVRQNVKRDEKAGNKVLNTIEQDVERIVNLALTGFYNLTLTEKRKHLSLIARNSPVFKDKIIKTLKDRDIPPKRLTYAYLNKEECDKLFSELTQKKGTGANVD